MFTPEQLILSSDYGIGRQGYNQNIAFFKSTAIAQETNIVRRALGLPETRGRAADPLVQTDIVPETLDREGLALPKWIGSSATGASC